MEGLGNGETENREAGFRVIRPSQSDAPCYQSVPDGNSEISVPSVLKISIRGGCYFMRALLGHREPKKGKILHARHRIINDIAIYNIRCAL